MSCEGEKEMSEQERQHVQAKYSAEGFEERQKYISHNAKKWYEDNILAIMTRFHLHSNSGIKPEELLQFFIEKEVLGDE